MLNPARIVIDTNVVFQGLTQQGNAAGFLIDAWLSGDIQPCISNALAYEYLDVLSRKLSEERWARIQVVLAALLDKSEFIPLYYIWRPSSPDPADEHVIDCAMNAGAIIVTANVRDFYQAQETLGVNIMTPVECVTWLLRSET